MLSDGEVVLVFNLNTDYLILLIIGLIGVLILLLPGDKFNNLDLTR